jgi:hypothetical protein
MTNYGEKTAYIRDYRKEKTQDKTINDVTLCFAVIDRNLENLHYS